MNFDKLPYFSVHGALWKGWSYICDQLKREITGSYKKRFVLIVECYQGVYDEELLEGFNMLVPDLLIHSKPL
jgi:hypothetical protein